MSDDFEPDDISNSQDSEDDDFNNGFDGWSWPNLEIVYCEICGVTEREEHIAKAHELHDSAKEALSPQLAVHRCGIDGQPLGFDRYCPPDEQVSEDYALALCPECWGRYIVLHTKETRMIIGLYPDISAIFEGME